MHRGAGVVPLDAVLVKGRLLSKDVAVDAPAKKAQCEGGVQQATVNPGSWRNEGTRRSVGDEDI